MQQATVNLLADMNAQPGSLQAGLVAATASTDATAPTSAITSPASGANVPVNTAVTISGTATDAGGGVVGGVEVSVDGGTTWRRATGRTAWTYIWTPTTTGSFTIRSRAADDSGNLETPSAGRTVTVTTVAEGTPRRRRSPRAHRSAAPPGSAQPRNVMVTFSEAMDAATINGTTIELRDSANALVSAVVSYNANVATLNPSTLAASTVYSVRVRGGMTDPRVKDVAGNALAADSTWSFTTAAAVDTTPPTITARSPAIGATGVSRTANMTVTFSEAMNAATIGATTFELRDPANNLVAAAVSYNSTTRVATLNPTPTLAALTTYTVRVVGGADGRQGRCRQRVGGHCDVDVHDRRRHHGADDQCALAGHRRHGGQRHGQCRRDLQRGHGPGDDQHQHGPVAQPGGAH